MLAVAYAQYLMLTAARQGLPETCVIFATDLRPRSPPLTTNVVLKDGWGRTGDLARYDKDGYFYIEDRLKELIKVRGFQVAPAELESVILMHPSVADVIVIGVPDPYSGELPRAYVVLKPSASATETDIQQFLKSNLASYKQLKGGVRFVTELPKTGSGKLLRRFMREEARKEEMKKSKL